MMQIKTRFYILIPISVLVLTILYQLYGYHQQQSLIRYSRIVQDQPLSDDAEPEPRCKIPRLDPYQDSAFRLIAEDELGHKKPKCMDRAQVRFHVEDSTSSLILVDSDAIFWKNLSCCYVGFPQMEMFTKNETQTPEKEICIPMSLESIEIKIPELFEFVDVQCRDNSSLQMIYQDQFIFMRVDPKKELLSNSKVDPDRDSLNVILIGLDSVAHVNFQRFMPKTRAYLLETLSAIEFWGRNVVGRGTQGNLIPTLTGCRMSSANEDLESYTEDCRLVWTHFAQLGYRIFRSEDEKGLSREFYPKLRENNTGRSETDYDWFRYITEMERRSTMYKDYQSFGCFDHQWVQHLILNRVAQVARHYGPNNRDRPYFNFVWTATATHDMIGYTRFMDEPVYQLLKELYVTNSLNNTALIFMSDHGMRYGTYSRTDAGATEFRMPFLYMVLPEWFRTKYAVATRNLQLNSHRLSTPFDLHATLLDLLDPKQKLSTPGIGKPRQNGGISLFEPIPLNRTCVSASIPIQYCVCNPKVPILNPSKNRHVVRIAHQLVSYLNGQLRDYNLTQCARLRLDRISLARLVSYPDDNDKKIRLYDVVVQTLPNQAFFEAAGVIEGERGVVINEQTVISRVNPYGNQSSCLGRYGIGEGNWLRGVCYCLL